MHANLQTKNSTNRDSSVALAKKNLYHHIRNFCLSFFLHVFLWQQQWRLFAFSNSENIQNLCFKTNIKAENDSCHCIAPASLKHRFDSCRRTDSWLILLSCSWLKFSLCIIPLVIETHILFNLSLNRTIRKKFIMHANYKQSSTRTRQRRITCSL